MWESRRLTTLWARNYIDWAIQAFGKEGNNKIGIFQMYMLPVLWLSYPCFRKEMKVGKNKVGIFCLSDVWAVAALLKKEKRKETKK
jgi:hypothetical protein